ncbi:hypothetical protein HNQ75_001301 [Rhizobium flavum]|jgi:hypothetical protein|uniref:Uncharacterized protein n=1 Tax=Pseudorhizobium flavum TaxID=1335061 RepID=A0A7W9YW36_9HYPH|nr:hypothetical protein [Pseudorhizobium flavum]
MILRFPADFGISSPVVLATDRILSVV